MSRPCVTVLIDTYNHERFIEEAIVSVLKQDFASEKMEILVVDDGSTDRTPEIVQKFEPRLRLIRKANGGQASAFNVGIPQAQGELVAFLDGDDWWAPSKLREVSDAFDKNPNIGAVGHGYYQVNANTKRTELLVPKDTFRIALTDVASVRSFHSACGFLATSKLAIRKKVLDQILPVPEELVFAADAYVYILAVAIAGAIGLDQALCYYRVHAENLSTTADTVKFQRRVEMQDCYVEKVIPRLAKLGLSNDVISCLVEPLRHHSERFYLLHKGGKRRRSFQLEWASYRSAYRDASFGYKIFKTLVLLLTLVLPPERFYQIKLWYTRNGFSRIREKIGSPVSAEPIDVVRRLE